MSRPHFLPFSAELPESGLKISVYKNKHHSSKFMVLIRRHGKHEPFLSESEISWLPSVFSMACKAIANEKEKL